MTSLTVVATGASGTRPWNLAASKDGQVLYIPNTTTPGTITVLNSNTLAIIASVAVGNSPEPIGVDPSGQLIFVANTSDSTVTVLDTATLTQQAVIPVSEAPVNYGNNNFVGQLNGRPLLYTATDETLIAGVTAVGGTSIASSGNITINTTGSARIGGTMVASGSVTVNVAANLTVNSVTAGLLYNAPTGVISGSNIAQAGSVSIAAGSINVASSIASPVGITANGGSVSMIASGGNIDLGTGALNVQANGGHVQLLSAGDILGKGTNNTFTARAAGTSGAFTGGGIELGAGMTSSTWLPDYFASRNTSFIATDQYIGNNVIITSNGSSGLIAADISGGGSVNVGSVNPLMPSNLNVLGGALVFHALNGRSINLDPDFNAFAFPFQIPAPAPLVPPLLAPNMAGPVVVNPPPALPVPRVATDTLPEQPVDTRSPSKQGNEPVAVRLSGAQNTIALACTPYLASNESEGGTMVVGESGAIFNFGESKSQPTQVNLTAGTVLVNAGEKGATINTSQGEQVLTKGSIAIVRESRSGVVRFLNLHSESTAQIVITDADNKQIILQAGPGEEIVVADGATAEEELIPIDGVERATVGAAILVYGKKVRKNRFNLEKMQEVAFGRCPAAATILRVRNPKPTGQEGHTVPISYVGGSLPAIPMQRSIATDRLGIKQSKDAQFANAGHNQWSLTHGEVLLNTPTTVTIDLGNTKACVPANSTALIKRTVQGSIVRNIGGSSKLQVITGNKRVNLSPGQEMVTSSQREELLQLLQTDNVGRRRLFYSQFGSSHVAIAEISLASVVTESSLVYNTMRAKDGRDLRTANQVLKTAAALAVVTASHGQYSAVSDESK